MGWSSAVRAQKELSRTEVLSDRLGYPPSDISRCTSLVKRLPRSIWPLKLTEAHFYEIAKAGLSDTQKEAVAKEAESGWTVRQLKERINALTRPVKVAPV